VTRMMEYIGLDPDRLMVKWVSGSEAQKFVDTVEELTEKVRALGPNRKLREHYE
jgi:F420-non-reducing hydrogenase iron-sulfur subunit